MISILLVLEDNYNYESCREGSDASKGVSRLL